MSVRALAITTANSPGMSTRKRKVSAVPPMATGQRRRLVGFVVGSLFLAAAGWTWFKVLEPRRYYRQAERLLDQNPERAAALLEAAVGQSGGWYPDAQLLWARAFVRLGQRQEALGCFNLIPRPATLNAKHLLALADDARRANDPLLAAYALEAIPDSSEHFNDACRQLMELRFQERRYQDVLAMGGEVTARRAGIPSTTFLMAYSQEQLADVMAAAASYAAYLDKSDGEPLERTTLARRQLLRLALQLGQTDLARRCLDELQTRGALTTDDQLSHARLLRSEGNLDAAWRLVRSLREDKPSNLDVIELHGALAIDRGEDAIAEPDLRQVLQSQPWNKGAHYRLAQVLQRSGRKAEAETHFRENRRLTDLSVKILELQRETRADSKLEQARLRELAQLYDAIGQTQMADQLRQQAVRRQTAALHGR